MYGMNNILDLPAMSSDIHWNKNFFNSMELLAHPQSMCTCPMFHHLTKGTVCSKDFLVKYCYFP